MAHVHELRFVLRYLALYCPQQHVETDVPADRRKIIRKKLGLTESEQLDLHTVWMALSFAGILRESQLVPQVHDYGSCRCPATEAHSGDERLATHSQLR